MSEQSPTRVSSRAKTESAADLPQLTPQADVFASGDAIVMLLDMPGADPDGLSVTLDRRQVTIAAPMGLSPAAGTLVHREIQEGRYRRAFALPDDVDEEHIAAALTDGTLRLTLPKSKQAGAKKIPVNLQ